MNWVKRKTGFFQYLRKAVLILQSGGGVGFSFGRIRPRGDVAGKGKATGPVSFLKVFDTAFWIIGQGGGRRSACMAVLPVHHPDIYDFIRCKEQEGVIEHFNISVGITDAFMEAVEKDTDFDLINPRDKKVWKTVGPGIYLRKLCVLPIIMVSREYCFWMRQTGKIRCQTNIIWKRRIPVENNF
jgi:ribonucleoside-diphosphate reductase alpha chain